MKTLPGLKRDPTSSSILPTASIHASRGVRVMRQENDPTDWDAHFSEIWADTQISRGRFLACLLKN
jgi:hypothetical protein